MCQFCERRKDVVGWNQPSLNGVHGNIHDEMMKVVIHDYQTSNPQLIITSPTLGEVLWGSASGGIATVYIDIKRCPICGRELGNTKKDSERYNFEIYDRVTVKDEFFIRIGGKELSAEDVCCFLGDTLFEEEYEEFREDSFDVNVIKALSNEGMIYRYKGSREVRLFRINSNNRVFLRDLYNKLISIEGM